MAEWRFWGGWSPAELRARLAALDRLERNFVEPVDALPEAPGWRLLGSEAVIATEPPGPPQPEGPFVRARAGVEGYRFSDPRIVAGHFDPTIPLERRRMLLEMKAAGLHFLCGAAVSAVRSESDDERTVFGFRYETLEGHIERGAEWFLLTKEHDSGRIHFRIAAAWRPGDFPNWWSRVGFAFVARHYQREWLRLSNERLALIASGGVLSA